jgi:hypothetical protein
MTTVTEVHCLKALDLYSENLMSLPNVQGVGVGGPLPDDPNVQCCIVVYLTSDAEVNLPGHLSVPDEGGSVVLVPVRSQVQGPLHPE